MKSFSRRIERTVKRKEKLADPERLNTFTRFLGEILIIFTLWIFLSCANKKINHERKLKINETNPSMYSANACMSCAPTNGRYTIHINKRAAIRCHFHVPVLNRRIHLCTLWTPKPNCHTTAAIRTTTLFRASANHVHYFVPHCISYQFTRPRRAFIACI